MIPQTSEYGCAPARLSHRPRREEGVLVPPDVAGLQHVVDAHGAVEELLYAPPEELYALRALVAK